MLLRKYIIFLLLFGYAQFSIAQTVSNIVSTLKSNQEKADTLQYYGQRFHFKGKPDSAIWCYEESLKYAKTLKENNAQIVQLYTKLSRSTYMKRQAQKALASIQMAKPHINKNTPNHILENYLFLTATYYRALLKYDSSLFYYQKAENLNYSYNPYGNWYVYYGIAEIFLASEDYSKAEEYYLRAYRLTKKQGIRMDHGMMINRLGNLYSTQENAAKFADIILEHEQFTKNRKRDYQKDLIHSLLFIDWGDKTLQEKITFLTNVKKQHIDNGFIGGVALCNYHIASLLEKNNQEEEALKYLYDNRNFYISQDAIADRYPNLKYIYELESKLGKTDKALLTANQLLDLSAKLTDLSNKELALDLEKKYETEKKIKEIELLNSKNKLTEVELLRQADLRLSLERENLLKDETINQQLKLASLSESEKELQFNELEKERLLNSSLARENELNQKLLINGKKRKQILWAGVILFAIAGIIILYQYRRQLVKNKIIDKQKEDLVMLNREIHHRVKNNLQVISSMLDLQSASTDDKFIAEKFQEGSQRVQSMAFIHQNLYQGENPGSIDIKEYIKMLTANLMESYNSVAEKVTLITDVEDIKLHSDTVIPLGLIINELVTNSLKYAFNTKDNGQISVVLKTRNEKLLLQVKDNGSGIPEDANVTAGPSFGYKIIRAFSQKLKAIITVNNQSGTDVQLLISKFRTA